MRQLPLQTPLWKNFKKSLINLQKSVLIKRINYFAPVLTNEYPILKKYLKMPRRFPKQIYWNYGTNRILLDDLSRKIPNQPHTTILLGNSGSKTNNHFEALDFLSHHKNRFHKIICPLSYGSSDYAQHVINKAKATIGNQFCPITDFMSYQGYINMIAQCSVVIMNHIRQQAAGNITAMLFNGATVFLREENPLFQHYQTLGIRLFSIQELIRDPSMLNIRLSSDEIESNRAKLKSFGGTKAALRKTKTLIETIINDTGRKNGRKN